jgi:serine/threonine protein kinase
MATSVTRMTIRGPPAAARHRRPPPGPGTAAAVLVCMMSTTSTEPKSTPVTVLEGRYELGALLGAGSMGEVYKAYDTVLGIDVAVKMMHVEHVSSRTRVARFSHEASIGARMLSPHIAKVLGLAVTGPGIPCIVYELLEGETLSARIAAAGGTLSVEETAEIVKQTARALARIHALGIVHRDVKPDNIFLTRDLGGRVLVKLLDLGIAEKVTVGGATQLVGTPEYMAPEVVFGSAPLDVRADIYALGVVAFECLTGSTPFSGSVDEVFKALRIGDRPSLLEFVPEMSREIDAWVDCALHADPYWRFSSVKEMMTGLEGALAVAKRSISGERVSIRQAA